MICMICRATGGDFSQIIIDWSTYGPQYSRQAIQEKYGTLDIGLHSLCLRYVMCVFCDRPLEIDPHVQPVQMLIDDEYQLNGWIHVSHIEKHKSPIRREPTSNA